METSEPAKRERYQEVEKALLKLVEEIEEIEEKYWRKRGRK